jgi:cell division protein FtsZ
LKGVEEIEKNVDALLVINNERLLDIYSDCTLENAFEKADDILTVSARSIAEIITHWGPQNVDFADVNTTLREGGVAIISSGTGNGENRLSSAIRNALESPLLNNNDIFKAKRILLNIYYSGDQQLMANEMYEIEAFMSKFTSDIEWMKWGKARDESLGSNIKITILASGFGLETISNLDNMRDEEIQKEKEIEIAETKRLFEKYFPGDMIERLTKGRIVYPNPFVFTLENLDDNRTIEALLNHPAYNRSSHVMQEIVRGAELKNDKLN